MLDRPEQIGVELLQRQRPFINEQAIMSTLSLAVIEAVEEAIYNSLLMAHTVVGRDGNTRYGLPSDEVVEIVAKLQGGKMAE